MRTNRLRTLSAIFFFCVCAASAQDIRALSSASSIAKTKGQRQAIYLQGFEYVIPELILGGEWSSSIKLTNRGSRAIPWTDVSFVDNRGNPMRATFRTSEGNTITDEGFSFMLGVGAVMDVPFSGGSSVQFGHAIIDCYTSGCGTPGLYGEVTLRNRNPTRPDFESVFPFENPSSFQYMLFDGRNGVTTTLYLVNVNLTPMTVWMDVVDAQNRILRTVTLPLQRAESQILALHALAPETVGIQGTLVIRTSGSTVPIVATGLRLNPSNSFTPLRTFVPSP